MAVPLPRQDRGEALARLRRHLVDNGTAPETRPEAQARRRAPSEGGDIPIHALLRPLVPGGVLERGTIVATPPRAGGTFAPEGAVSYLTLALIAGATAGGAWAGVIGFPNFGIAAASGLGADLSKVLMLDDPGERWLDATAILAGAVDLVLLHAPRRPNATQLRRLAQRVRPTERQRGCVLVVTSPWEAAHLALTTHDPQWNGLGDGTGHLTGRHVTITATGRVTRGRRREVEVWLPARDGSVAEYVSQKNEETEPGEQQPGQEPQPKTGTRLRIA